LKTAAELSVAELAEQLLSYADDLERDRKRARHAPAVMREAAQRLAPAMLAGLGLRRPAQLRGRKTGRKSKRG
jgi:hypothetical protein